MNEDDISFEDKIFYDWVRNEIQLMNSSQRAILIQDILKVENFASWFSGNFYTFDYSFKTKPKSPFVPSFDRKPFIYLLKREGRILHGFNLNYLNPLNFMRFFMEDLYSFYLKDFDLNETVETSRIQATYKNIKRYDRLFISRVIYRKYDVKNINNVKIVPKIYAKIFATMGNGLFTQASKNNVYLASEVYSRHLRSRKTK